jgi:hypothetical protein
MGQLYNLNDRQECQTDIIKELQERESQREEQRIRAMAGRRIPEWDETWGGPKPFGMSREQRARETDETRRKLGLREISPPPWYKRVARFYSENWENIFMGFGPTLTVLVLISMGLLVFINLGRATGWWGGAL